MHDTATASYQRFPTEPVLLQSSLIHKGYPSDRGNLMEHFLFNFSLKLIVSRALGSVPSDFLYQTDILYELNLIVVALVQ
jgi:hypothetical protein